MGGQRTFTQAEAAEILGVVVQLVRRMTNEPCPKCTDGLVDGEPCPRCRGTGVRLPYEEGLPVGTGVEKHIYDWALELPDVQHRRSGRGEDPEGIVLERWAEDTYIVHQDETPQGRVVRLPVEERRRWVWERDGERSEERFRSARAAAVALTRENETPGD